MRLKPTKVVGSSGSGASRLSAPDKLHLSNFHHFHFFSTITAVNHHTAAMSSQRKSPPAYVSNGQAASRCVFLIPDLSGILIAEALTDPLRLAQPPVVRSPQPLH